MVCGTSVPVDLGYDPFYVHHCDVLGISVMGSADVDPAAVEAAALIVEAMIGHRLDVIEAMIANDLRVAVTGEFEFTSDMPEYRDIYELFPGTDWDTRARGLGATPFMPLSSVGEENVLCLPGDVYVGESIMVHEFAHTIHLMGLDTVDPTFTTRLIDTYDAAITAELWDNTYAGSDFREYWAEGVQSYFNVEEEGPVGGDGIQNDIDKVDELEDYDPALFALIEEFFKGVESLPVCQESPFAESP